MYDILEWLIWTGSIVDSVKICFALVVHLQIPDFRNAVIVARNPNSVKRVTSYAERLRLSIAVIHGEEKDEDESCDGRTSPPPIVVETTPPPLMQVADFGINPIPGKWKGNLSCNYCAITSNNVEKGGVRYYRLKIA